MPFKVSLKANLKVIEDLAKLRQSVKTDVIQNGLDSTLSSSLEELRRKLYVVINEEIRYKKTITNETEAKEDIIDIPKADKDLIKYIFKVDLTKVKSAGDFTKLINENAFVISNNRVRLQIPETPDGNMEQSYVTALSRFQNAIFIDTSHSNVRYFVVNNFDPRQYVKIVCSPDSGMSSRTQKKHDNYKNSNKMPTQPSGEMSGRFSQWTMNQAGVQKIRESSLDITSVVDKVKTGDFEEAVNILKHSVGGKSLAYSQQQIENLRDNLALTPSVEAYSNIVSLIRNLKIQKKIKEDKTEYSLVSYYSDETKGYAKFFTEMRKNISMWVVFNESLWFAALVKVAQQVISKFER